MNRKIFVKAIGSSLYFSSLLIANEETPVSVYIDALYLKRNYIDSTKIAVELDLPSKNTMLTTDVLVNKLGWEPGVRGGVKAQFSDKYGLDANIIYASVWNAKSTRSLADEVSFPFKDADYASDFTQADSMSAKYRSSFLQIEANGICFLSPRWENYFSVNTVFGLKTMFINEGLNLAFDNPPDISHYKIDTKNIATVAQVGLTLQIRPYEIFAWELILKGGVGINAAEQKTFLGNANDLIVLRDFKTHAVKSAVTGDAYARATYRPNKNFEFYTGYLFVFASGIALAPEQIDKNTTSNSGKKLHANGNYIVHGVVGGITANF